MNILTLSTTFPNPTEPGLGIFVRSRMEHVANHAMVRVIAPVGVLDYSRASGKFLRWRVPRRRSDGRLSIWHPPWLYPPWGGVWNSLCLFLWTLPLVWRLSREAAIDVIDAHFGYPDGITAALLGFVLRKPFTVTLRGNETLHARYRCRRAAMRWALRRAARVITVSKALRDFAVALGVDPCRAVTVPNGVNTTLFHPYPRSPVGNVPPEILSAGYLIERKGHHHVIRAIAGLRARGVDCRLSIAGGAGREGRFETQLRALVRELRLEDTVAFLGPLPPASLARRMSEAAVFCLASAREGWPNVVHEALACGTPVVATDTGAVRDLIPTEDYGFVVPVGDPKVLEEALERALCKKWDREAIARWGQSRSWEQVAAETLALLRQAASGA